MADLSYPDHLISSNSGGLTEASYIAYEIEERTDSDGDTQKVMTKSVAQKIQEIEQGGSGASTSENVSYSYSEINDLTGDETIVLSNVKSQLDSLREFKNDFNTELRKAEQHATNARTASSEASRSESNARVYSDEAKSYVTGFDNTVNAQKQNAINSINETKESAQESLSSSLSIIRGLDDKISALNSLVLNTPEEIDFLILNEASYNNLANPDNDKIYFIFEERDDLEYKKISVSYDSDKGIVSGEGYYKDGDEVTLKARPYPLYVFDKWKVGNDAIQNAEATYTFIFYTTQYFTDLNDYNTTKGTLLTQEEFNNLTSDQKIKVQGTPTDYICEFKTYSLDIYIYNDNAEQEGIINLVSITQTNNRITLTAVPLNTEHDKYTFDHWRIGNNSYTNNPFLYGYLANNDQVEAYFTQQTVIWYGVSDRNDESQHDELILRLNDVAYDTTSITINYKGYTNSNKSDTVVEQLSLIVLIEQNNTNEDVTRSGLFTWNDCTIQWEVTQHYEGYVQE